MPCRIQPSSLSGVLAEQLGRIEAEVRGRLDSEYSANFLINVLPK